MQKASRRKIRPLGLLPNESYWIDLKDYARRLEVHLGTFIHPLKLEYVIGTTIGTIAAAIVFYSLHSHG